MRRFPWLLFAGVSFFTVSLFFASACWGRQQEPGQLESGEPEYTLTATIKDLMLSIIDPSADVVWESVGTIVGSTGTEERVPRTDEEWTNVRHGAIRLVEATNLLMMSGRHVARAGETSEAPGVELEPEQMEALIIKDREAWNRHTQALREASLAMLRAIDARDSENMLEAGERIEIACESCHSQYWYPNQVLPPGYGSRTP